MFLILYAAMHLIIWEVYIYTAAQGISTLYAILFLLELILLTYTFVVLLKLVYSYHNYQFR